jgi:hypothetical protein
MQCAWLLRGLRRDPCYNIAMAKGKVTTVGVIINNKPASTVSRSVELVMVNNQLVIDNNDINPGVKLN